jgi:hypothetical protein
MKPVHGGDEEDSFDPPQGQRYLAQASFEVLIT